MATREIARARASVIMCAASDNSARLPVINAPITSAIMKLLVSPRAIHRRRSWLARAWPWLCPALMKYPQKVWSVDHRAIGQILGHGLQICHPRDSPPLHDAHQNRTWTLW